MSSQWLSVQTSTIIPRVHCVEWNQWTLRRPLEDRDDASQLWTDLMKQTDDIFQAYFPSLRHRFSSYGRVSSQIWKRVYVCMNMQWSSPSSWIHWSTDDDDESEEESTSDADDESAEKKSPHRDREDDDDDDDEEQEDGLMNVHTTTKWMSYRSWILHGKKWQRYWNSSPSQLQSIELGIVVLRPFSHSSS